MYFLCHKTVEWHSLDYYWKNILACSWLRYVCCTIKKRIKYRGELWGNSKVLAPVVKNISIKYGKTGNWASYGRLEWKLKFCPNVIKIKCNGITFHSQEFSSYNILTQEHCTYNFCFILGHRFCHKTFFCIFWSCLTFIVIFVDIYGSCFLEH